VAQVFTQDQRIGSLNHTMHSSTPPPKKKQNFRIMALQKNAPLYCALAAQQKKDQMMLNVAIHNI
jgi:hypothetical protein